MERGLTPVCNQLPLRGLSFFFRAVSLHSKSNVIIYKYSAKYSTKGKRKGCDVWPSMVTHTLNLCSAFNPSKCTHTHTAVSNEQTHMFVIVKKVGTSRRHNGFILYKRYVLMPHANTTPKISPHRKLCIFTFSKKNSLCMIYKRFEKWGHGVMSWIVTFFL